MCGVTCSIRFATGVVTDLPPRPAAPPNAGDVARAVSRRCAAGDRGGRETRAGTAARSEGPVLAADWLLESGIGIGTGPAVYVHVGGCHMAGKRCRGVLRDFALAAPDLRADARIDARQTLGFSDEHGARPGVALHDREGAGRRGGCPSRRDRTGPAAGLLGRHGQHQRPRL
ncbi:DUF6233 domain-containing protein [Streptomyces hirsutus]|uniref:DUF6233 domain-containing protein n=1 Tax=Streptomyces hirsutus TaxID=35620 RepID=UPI0033A56C58